MAGSCVGRGRQHRRPPRALLPERMRGHLHRAVQKAGSAGPCVPLLLFPRPAARGQCAPHLGRQRHLSRHLPGPDRRQIAEKRKKKAPAYRVRVPDEEITFLDGCMGPHTENLLRDCGDFYLRRADGVFAYQLAVVVDDARMGVTEVVRGSDLLSSTARQLYLYRLLGLQAPTFAHCPLLLAPDGGGCPSGTGTRAWRTCGKNTPRRRSWASWPMPTACSRNRRPARRKASSRVFPGQRCPSRTSACRRGCSESNYNKGRSARFRCASALLLCGSLPGGFRAGILKGSV